MAFDLGFSPEFFMSPYDDHMGWRGQKPTTVYQALMSMPALQWRRMAREVFNEEDVDVYTVLEKIRETNTCNQLHAPISVYIDEDGYHTVDVY
jgi:hypothetical protein